MRIVIDTNVVISGTFFGGYPRKVFVRSIFAEFCTYARDAQYSWTRSHIPLLFLGRKPLFSPS